MKSGLSHRLLAAVLSGAVAAGGAIFAAPVLAAGPAGSRVLAEPADEPSGDVSEEPSENEPPVVEEPAPSSESPSPGTSSSESSPSPSSPAVPSSPDSTPVSSAPATSKPATSGPITSGPTTSGPITSKPVTSGPVTSKPVATTPPKPVDRTPPSGSFTLSATALWVGQTLTFTQRATDFGDGITPDARIIRRIDWGDGTAVTLAPAASSQTKQYARAGRFTITETLTDEAKNVFRVDRTITITVPGTYKLTKTTVYQGVTFGINVSNVPAGTRNIVVNWGDGAVTGHPGRNGRIDYYILKHAKTGKRISGNFPIKIAFVNPNGSSAYQPVGTIRVLTDNTKPAVRITKPAKTSRVSSWRTITGTVTDTQSGAPFAYATVMWANAAGKTYCLTPDSKWKRYTNDAQLMKFCADKGVKLPVTKGKWTLKVPAGLANGYLLTWVWTWDWADNYADATRQATLTRK